MAVKAGFKRTDAGIFPEDWTVQPLREIAGVTSGKRLPLGYLVGDKETPYPYIRVTDMRPGYVDTRNIKYVPPPAYPAISRYRIFRDDLFISVAGTLGLVGTIPDELDGANLTENADRISSISCDKNYLLHVMLSQIVQGVIASEQTVGAQPKLALVRIRNFAIPLPPAKSEQKAIAAALSDLDALLGALDRLIAKKRDLKQAAMQQLLTGQTRLPGFSGKWEERRVCDMGDVLAGKALNVHGAGRQRPYLRTKNVLDGRIDTEDVLEMPMTEAEFERFCIRRGDVLLNEGQSLELVGRCSIYTDELAVPCAMQNQLLRFRAKPTTAPSFAEHLFRRCQQDGTFASIATQTTSVAHLGSVRFSRLTLRWPLEFREQDAIAGTLDDMDDEITTLEQRRDKTRLLKQGMMQELLAGKTRLV
jgi:type I restriction enzyme S subunit